MEHLPNPRAKLHPESSTKADLPANSSRNRRDSGAVATSTRASELVSRRSAIASGAAAVLGAAVASRAQAASESWQVAANPLTPRPGETITGPLSGRPVFIPNVNVPPMPSFAPSGPLYNGEPTSIFDVAKLSAGHPDVCSHRRRFSLLLPATNTAMESELWNILVKNEGNGLDGVGLHTSPVLTPSPDLSSPEAIERFRQHFLGGVTNALNSALLAKPQFLIMGMSLEHIISGIEPIRATAKTIEQGSDLSWATWHDAAKAALDRYGAKRIGLLAPFVRSGIDSATKMFTELGFDVVASVSFACGHAQHIAHIPNDAKERAILELLATKGNKLDAIVQCGTNMSMTPTAEALEPKIGIPILGINATLLWYALRESGITARAQHAGRLLREH